MRTRDIMRQLGIKCSRKDEYKTLMIPTNFFRIRVLHRRIRDGECLLWSGNTQNQGYGQIRYGFKRVILIHRLAAVAYGILDSLDDPRVVCHKCNTLLCFEKSHLRADTQKGNLQQMYAEGRDRNQFTKEKV